MILVGSTGARNTRLGGGELAAVVQPHALAAQGAPLWRSGNVNAHTGVGHDWIQYPLT